MIKKNVKVYGVSRKDLKRIILDFSVDDTGKKVTKFELCRNKDFLKAIKCRKDEISFNTIQSWYKRLANVEPYGEMTDKFLFEYHQKVTKRIDKNKNYYDWTMRKLNKEGRIEYKIKSKIKWSENKKLLAMLKMNNDSFDIEKYRNISLKDLKFLVKINITDEKFTEIEQKLEDMIKQGDETVVDLAL